MDPCELPECPSHCSPMKRSLTNIIVVGWHPYLLIFHLVEVKNYLFSRGIVRVQCEDLALPEFGVYIDSAMNNYTLLHFYIPLLIIELG